mmetsp:Transcript_114322/g.363315  ORF Transcript_114322/g.363315 Transcript_114322/m.363315 type:complete len:255 (-) Transcript_114322:421-1185(-)
MLHLCHVRALDLAQRRVWLHQVIVDEVTLDEQRGVRGVEDLHVVRALQVLHDVALATGCEGLDCVELALLHLLALRALHDTVDLVRPDGVPVEISHRLDRQGLAVQLDFVGLDGPLDVPPISPILASMPAALMPALVPDLDAWMVESHLGLKATVKAQSTMRPPTCTPKSNLQTSSYCRTALSPQFGVQCTATQFREQPVGKPQPHSRPLAEMSSWVFFSSLCTMSVMVIPGRMYDWTYRLVCLWHSAALRIFS